MIECIVFFICATIRASIAAVLYLNIGIEVATFEWILFIAVISGTTNGPTYGDVGRMLRVFLIWIAVYIVIDVPLFLIGERLQKKVGRKLADSEGRSVFVAYKIERVLFVIGNVMHEMIPIQVTTFARNLCAKHID
jgi:hypothetical protein